VRGGHESGGGCVREIRTTIHEFTVGLGKVGPDITSIS